MTDTSNETDPRDKLEQTVREQLERVGASAKATGAGLALIGVSALGSAKALTGAFVSLTGEAIKEIYVEGKRVRDAERAAAAAKPKSATG